MMVDEGLASRLQRESRYKRNRSYYYNDPPSVSTPAFEGAADVHFPIVRPTLDALSAQVVGTITSRSPYGVPICGDEDAQEFLQKVLQHFAEKDGLKYALKKASPAAGYANKSWVKSAWDKKRVGFKFTSIEPFSAVVYPEWAECLEDAKLYGDVFYRRRGEIKALQKAGKYHKGEIPSSTGREDAAKATGDMGGNSKPSDVTTVLSDDEPIECWDLIYKDDDGKVQMYVIARESGFILRGPEPFKGGEDRYMELSYQPTTAIDGYWGASSVAQDIQGLQIGVNDLVTDFTNGQRMAMYGAVFMKGGMDQGQAITRFGAGEVVTGNTDGMQIFQPTVDLGPILPQVQLYMSQAYEVARVGPNARGSGDANSDTATEAEISRAGQQVATDEYIETFGEGLLTGYRFMQVNLLAYFDEWFPRYFKVLDLDEDKVDQYKEWLAMDVIWRLNISSVGAAPAAQLALVRSIAEMSADPEFGYDKYEIGSRVAGLLEAMGLPDADDIQHPQSIEEATERLAAQFDIDPDVLQVALIAVLNLQDDIDMGGMEAQQANGAPQDGAGSQVAGQPQPTRAMQAG